MKIKCKTCKETKDCDSFYFRKDNGKYRTSCKLCVIERNSKREKHWLEQALIHSRHRAENQGVKTINFKRKELEKYWKEQNIDSDKCTYCGKQADSLDHYIAMSNGGNHEKENCVPSCKECNSEKQTKPPELFKQIVESNFTLKQCAKCKELKDIDEFYNDKARKRGKYKYCISCCKSKAKGVAHYEIHYNCPHCGKEGKGNIMLAHHFDNCKSNSL